METVKGKAVSISFDGKRCIHARQCILGEPEVFRANVQGPWIHPDAVDPERIARVAHACPSGAITYERHDGKPGEAAPAVNRAVIRENGPVALHAEMTLDGAPVGYRATLCRCGASKTKPFCDGSHTEAKFAATGEPETKESQPLTMRGGPLSLTAVPNGPLQVEGNLEITSGTGRTINRTAKTWLCRCGASKTKPYCDGSHKAAGFVAP